MSPRFPVLLVAAALAVAALAAGASSAPAQAPRDGLTPPIAPPNIAPGAAKGAYSLDTLFSALKIAPDEASAKAIEDRIWAIWLASDSDTCNLLMSRVKDAIEDKDFDLAIKLLDAVVAIKPDYVE